MKKIFQYCIILLMILFANSKDHFITNHCTEEHICRDKKINKFIPFILEIFPSFGLGHYYKGDTYTAALKWISFIFSGLYIILFPLIAKTISIKYNSKLNRLIFTFLFVFAIVLLLSWYVIDVFRLGINLFFN